jgi:hypothetical protein
MREYLIRQCPKWRGVGAPLPPVGRGLGWGSHTVSPHYPQRLHDLFDTSVKAFGNVTGCEPQDTIAL